MRYGKYLTLLMISVFFVIQGCAYTIKTGDIPQLKTGSPLHEIKPLMFEIEEFADERQVMDKYKDNEIQMKKNYVGFYSVGIPVLIDRNVTDIITEAISNELKRNGHSVIKPSSGNESSVKTDVDVIIKGAVTKYYCFINSTTDSRACCVEAKIAAIPTKDSGKTFIKIYRGNLPEKPRVSIGRKVFGEILNMLLLDMIEDFTTDPEFLDLLRDVKKS